MMTMLERLAAPFRELAGWQEQHAVAAAERAASIEARQRTRHEAGVRELVEAFATATPLVLRRYDHLADGEAREGTQPAAEYFHRTAEVRLYHLFEPQETGRAWVIRALAMRLDRGAGDPGAAGDLVDVKPTDFSPIEGDGVTLGPVLEFHNAAGTRWRFFLEVGTGPSDAGAGAGRGETRTRRILAEATL
jgi:hypothetical protein